MLVENVKSWINFTQFQFPTIGIFTICNSELFAAKLWIKDEGPVTFIQC